MEFFDKLTKKATETYKGAAEKTSKLAKEAKLKMKINENKSKIKDIYEEIGKKVYQKHSSGEGVCIKNEIEEDVAKIDILSAEIEKYHTEILELSDLKVCVKCKESIEKNAKFCPKCGEEQPEVAENSEEESNEVDSENSSEDESAGKEESNTDPIWDGNQNDSSDDNKTE